jgi:hypothetical protein
MKTNTALWVLCFILLAFRCGFAQKGREEISLNQLIEHYYQSKYGLKERGNVFINKENYYFIEDNNLFINADSISNSDFFNLYTYSSKENFLNGIKKYKKTDSLITRLFVSHSVITPDSLVVEVEFARATYKKYYRAYSLKKRNKDKHLLLFHNGTLIFSLRRNLENNKWEVIEYKARCAP